MSLHIKNCLKWNIDMDLFYKISFHDTFRKVLEEQITPVILYIEEHAEDDGEVHEADEDDHHHARVNPHPTPHVWKPKKEFIWQLQLVIFSFLEVGK